MIIEVIIDVLKDINPKSDFELSSPFVVSFFGINI